MRRPTTRDDVLTALALTAIVGSSSCVYPAAEVQVVLSTDAPVG